MADIAFEKDLSVAETGIEGLKVVDLAVHGDSRGWFMQMLYTEIVPFKSR